MHALEQLLRQHIDQRMSWDTVIEPLAETIAQDILADEAFRAQVKVLIQVRLGGGRPTLERYHQELLRPGQRLQRWAYALLALGVIAIIVIAVTLMRRA